MNFLTTLLRYLSERRARNASRNLQAFVSRLARPVPFEVLPNSWRQS